jgi:hypothetical protein
VTNTKLSPLLLIREFVLFVHLIREKANYPAINNANDGQLCLIEHTHIDLLNMRCSSPGIVWQETVH